MMEQAVKQPKWLRKANEKAKRVDPCTKCGANMWKTLVKGKFWQCRTCKALRQMKNVTQKGA